MSDAASKYTDKQIKSLDRKIQEVYSEAEKDIKNKFNSFMAKFQAKYEIHEQELKDGKITQDQFNSWVRGQVFQGDQWKTKQEQIVDTITHSNQIATDMINGRTIDVFCTNANYMSYTMEHGEGVNFGFGLYDKATVTKLIKDDPEILPKWKINEQKDYIWNYKKVNNSITQGIIQGESLDKISKRLTNNLVMQNENLMKTFARTAMTGAQNSGRDTQFMDAKSKGIEVRKQWMATLDSHTRDSHAAIDGETIEVGDKWHPIKFSNGCKYPGDPQGPPHEVYNCRCTLVGDIKDYPAVYERYDNIDGKPIANMTYKQWEEAKKGGTFETVVDSFQSALGKVQSVAEVNDLMNNQGWFRDLGAIGPDGKRMYSQADLTGVDLESAKAIAASYEQVYTKYPQLIGKFDAPNAQPKNMRDNTYAWCYLKQHGKVEVNPNRYDNWTKISKSYEHDVEIGWHPYGTTAESVIVHEIGHAIDGLLAREGVLGGVTSTGEYRFASSSMKTTVMKRAAKVDEVLGQRFEIWGTDKETMTSAVHDWVSEYATKNNQEWFAECFAEYITSANPRSVATEFGKELEKLMEGLK